MASPRELAFLACFVVAHSHGGLTFPPPRNNHGNINPAIPDPPGGSGDKNHPGGSCAGGSCLWFQEGCYIGCPNCTLEMPQGGNRYNKPNCEHPLEPTLPEKYRTYNAKNLSPNGDWSRYHPWRAPGRAPVADPCGFAGGYTKAQGGGGETPVGAHQGDLGSKLPPLEGVKTEWVAGGVAEVGWMIAANHGGGYLYSVCPKSEALTELCFQKYTLPFVGKQHTIRYLNKTQPDVLIDAVGVSVGTWPAGSEWRQNPVAGCNCDLGRGCHLEKGGSNESQAYEDGASPVPNDKRETCSTGTQIPVKFAYGYGQQLWNEKSGPGADTFVITDQVRVPETTGEYILRWRWDTEQNPQIWTHCADITVVKTTTSPTPAPAAPPFHCIHDKCVPSTSGGLSNATCQATCGHLQHTLAMAEEHLGLAPSPPSPSLERGEVSDQGQDQLVYWHIPSNYWICNHTNGTAALPADAQQHEVARCKRPGMQAVKLLCEVAVNGSVSAHFVNSYGNHYDGEPVTSGCSCAGGASQPSRAQTGGCCVGSDQYARVCGNVNGR